MALLKRKANLEPDLPPVTETVADPENVTVAPDENVTMGEPSGDPSEPDPAAKDVPVLADLSLPPLISFHREDGDDLPLNVAERSFHPLDIEDDDLFIGEDDDDLDEILKDDEAAIEENQSAINAFLEEVYNSGFNDALDAVLAGPLGNAPNDIILADAARAVNKLRKE